MTTLAELLGSVPAPALAAVAAVAGAAGAIAAAFLSSVVAKFIVTPFLSARDKQDRESEWRKHAIELTKLDLERKLKTRAMGDTTPLRPSILDFLANYRDLQELGLRESRWPWAKPVTPAVLYQRILNQRITDKSRAALQDQAPSAQGQEPAHRAAAPDPDAS